MAAAPAGARHLGPWRHRRRPAGGDGARELRKTALLARNGDHPAGAAFAGIHDGIAMLHALYVKPQERRQGTGGLLVRAAAKWALGHGADTIGLIVTQGNHAANPLYADLGLSRVGHYHYRVHPEAAG
ncbi:MAG: GNAT family N-acetyltransferase [Paracoccaceae bacterium]